MTKNRWVVKSYGDFRHDAANVSYNDLPYLAHLLDKDGYDARVGEMPFINRLVSANVQPAIDSLNAPAPYVVREVTLKRSKPGETIRVGIVGFTEPKPVGPNQTENTIAGFQITDPFQAARRVIPELKSKVDFIIALAYMPQDMSQRLATENPEIDTIIGARRVHSMEEVQHFNRATIAYAYMETKYVGEMRVYVNEQGEVTKQVNRFAGLDSFIPDDPDARDAVTSAHDEFTAIQNQAAKEVSSLPPSTPPPMLSRQTSAFVGSETCAACHAEAFQVWEKSAHAHAMATLERKNQQFDTECVGCHVVAYQKGGFDSLVTTPQLANVQCEACHGAGRTHAEGANKKGYGFMPTPVGCVQCHTQPNSPDFNFEAYWAQIKH
ncbi:MAG TPA: multiheme c-type cytochrome [Blastocatellia bacterium]|nr:multiheme c-type cytochrome [Blastocatellia bacterium]